MKQLITNLIGELKKLKLHFIITVLILLAIIYRGVLVFISLDFLYSRQSIADS